MLELPSQMSLISLINKLYYHSVNHLSCFVFESVVPCHAMKFVLIITVSDAFLIATLNVNETSSEHKNNLLTFQRVNRYRFCLTPFFEDLEVDSYIQTKN